MNESDSLYQQVQTCSYFPQEIYISPSSLALDGSVRDPTNGDTKTTVLMTIGNEVITAVDVDPSEERIKDFTKSDVITAVPVLTTAAPTNTLVAVAVDVDVAVELTASVAIAFLLNSLRLWQSHQGNQKGRRKKRNRIFRPKGNSVH